MNILRSWLYYPTKYALRVPTVLYTIIGYDTHTPYEKKNTNKKKLFKLRKPFSFIRLYSYR